MPRSEYSGELDCLTQLIAEHVTRNLHEIHICRTCCKTDEAPPGPALAQRLRAALANEAGLSDVKVRDARCMLTCGSPVAVSLTCPGKMSYLFADVQAKYDLDNLLALVRLYRASPGGIINDARPIGRLRHCLKGRLPATATDRD